MSEIIVRNSVYSPEVGSLTEKIGDANGICTRTSRVIRLHVARCTALYVWRILKLPLLYDSPTKKLVADTGVEPVYEPYEDSVLPLNESASYSSLTINTCGIATTL